MKGIAAVRKEETAPDAWGIASAIDIMNVILKR